MDQEALNLGVGEEVRVVERIWRGMNICFENNLEVPNFFLDENLSCYQFQ